MNLYQRMTETLALNMGDTLLVNQQFEEAIHRIAELEKEIEWLSTGIFIPSYSKRQSHE